MKKLITLFFVLGFLKSISQEPIEVKVEDRPSSQGVVAAFEVVVPQAKEKDAIDLWKKTIMPGGLFKKNPKMEKVKDEWIVRDIVLSDITSLPLNIYTQVSTFPGNIYVRVFLQSEGGFIGSKGSSQTATDAAIRYVREYAVELYKQAVTRELRQEENNLKALENDLNKMQKKNKNFNKKATTARQDERQLKETVQQQEAIRENSPEVIDTGTGTDKKSPQEILEKELKNNEKELKKAQNAQTKFERKIGKNERAQRDKEDAIAKQKAKVKDVETKLKNIR